MRGQLVQTVLSNLTTVQRVVPTNTERNYLMIQNIGSVDVTIGFTSDLTAGNGITLSPGGLGSQGGYLIWEKEFIPTNPIYAAAATAGTVVVMEG